MNGDEMLLQWQKKIDKLNLLPLSLIIDTSDQSFRYQSSGNATIHGRYFHASSNRKKITICLYHGLGAHTHTEGYVKLAKMWCDAGYDVIGFDVRNQGGKTIYTYGGTGTTYGLYVSGIDTNHYYYADTYLDAIRLVDVSKIIFEDHHHIIASGGSQGGALALFAGIIKDEVCLILADMPSNIDIQKLMYTKSGHLNFLRFLKDHIDQTDHVIEVLDTIDLLNFTTYVHKPVLLSSGDQDEVCPLEHTALFYQQIDCQKDLKIYPGFGHGGFDDQHFDEKLNFMNIHIK